MRVISQWWVFIPAHPLLILRAGVDLVEQRFAGNLPISRDHSRENFFLYMLTYPFRLKSPFRMCHLHRHGGGS